MKSYGYDIHGNELYHAMSKSPRPHAPVYPRTGAEIRLALRARFTWKKSPEAVRARFISLYVRGKRTPDHDVVTAWTWYNRGREWERNLRE